ncbi:MAG: HD domain-containing protein [Candidatus Hodarchaeota archaeon]
MWKSKLLEFIKNFEHPAWGKPHFERIYEMSIKLAELNEVEVDKDALFAAAYLHDIGAFTPYYSKEKDHSEIAVKECREILSSIGFPSNKIPLVKDVIKSHMFYSKPSDQIESLIFHDADTLDFMGMIGITRLLSIVGKDDWTPDLNSTIKIIQRFSKELPQYLHTQAAKEIGYRRKEEMEEFLKNLKKQTNQFKVL